VYPIAGPAVPLPWQAGTTRVVTTGWRRTLDELEVNGRPLEEVVRFLSGVRVRDEDVPTLTVDDDALPLLSVTVSEALAEKPFGGVVFATGAGVEQFQTPGSKSSFRSLDFWEDDPLSRPASDFPQDPLGQPILISGRGDGAIQDLLRIVTTLPHPGELYTQLQEAAFSTDFGALERAVLSAEEQALRSYAWAATPEEASRIDLALEEAHREQLDKLWMQDASAVEGVFRRVLRRPVPEVTLCFGGGEAFSRCYAINRFCALAVLRYCDERLSGRIRRFTKNRVRDVLPGTAMATQPTRAIDWVGRPAQVFIDQQPQVFGTFYWVLLRHGLDHEDGNPKLSRRLHVLPFHVAGE
jgi:hypothetical protein